MARTIDLELTRAEVEVIELEARLRVVPMNDLQLSEALTAALKAKKDRLAKLRAIHAAANRPKPVDVPLAKPAAKSSPDGHAPARKAAKASAPGKAVVLKPAKRHPAPAAAAKKPIKKVASKVAKKAAKPAAAKPPKARPKTKPRR